MMTSLTSSFRINLLLPFTAPKALVIGCIAFKLNSSMSDPSQQLDQPLSPLLSTYGYSRRAYQFSEAKRATAS